MLTTLHLDVCVVAKDAPPSCFDHFTSTMVAGVRAQWSGPTSLPVANVYWVETELGPDVEAELVRRVRSGAWWVTREPHALVHATSAGSAAALSSLTQLTLEVAELADSAPLRPWLGNSVDSPGTLDGPAEALGSYDGRPRAAVGGLGDGLILWLGTLPPLEGVGFRVEAHVPVRAAVYQLQVDEVLACAFERLHGVSVTKLLGPYGAATFGWQVHMEDVGGMWNRGFEKTAARFAQSRQVPTYSFIRSQYWWGKRVPGLVHLPREGPDTYSTQPSGAAFFSGQWLTQVDGAPLGFAPSASFCEPYTQAHDVERAYPAPSGNARLLLSGQDGLVHEYDLVGRPGQMAVKRGALLVLSNGQPLTVGPRAGLTVASRPSGSGRLLVVAEQTGDLRTFIDEGAGWVARSTIRAMMPLSPRLVDWERRGILDLLVGTEDGHVVLYRDFERAGLSDPVTLFRVEASSVTPFPVADDSRRYVLFGARDGRVSVFEDGAVRALPTVGWTYGGSKEAYLQQDSVPVLVDCDGTQQLVVGAAVVGHAEPPTDEWRSFLHEPLERLRTSAIPVLPHVFLFPKMGAAEVARELQRHRQHFSELGLSWSEGANQHCWTLPENDTGLSLLLQQVSGLHFNGGWRPPGLAASPPRDPPFALSYPFRLHDGQQQTDFLLMNPVDAMALPKAVRCLCRAGVPCVSFIHGEYPEPRRGTLDATLRSLDELRVTERAVCATETQIARAVIAALTWRVSVAIDEEGALWLVPDDRDVPAWAQRSSTATSVRLRGPRSGYLLCPDAVASTWRQAVVSTVPREARIGAEPPQRRWTLVAANGPVILSSRGVEVPFAGFQEFQLRGRDLVIDWPGAHVRETEEGYVVTRFGDAGRALVRPQTAMALHIQRHMPWKSCGAYQDQWVVRSVYPGRAAPGFFLDVGAGDGTTASPSYALEKGLGWSGILVEPNGFLFSQLSQSRRAHAVHACVAATDGECDCSRTSRVRGVEARAPVELQGQRSIGPFSLSGDPDRAAGETGKRTAFALSTLLDLFGAPRRIDFASIQAGGCEWSLLAPFAFHRYEFGSLCIRTKSWNQGTLVDGPHAEEIRTLLTDYDYFYDREHSRVHEYDFFLHSSTVAPPLRRTRRR